jgi:RND superfamily putative drug exporter
MQSLALFCYRRRWWVLALWIALAVGLGVGAAAAGNSYSEDFDLPGAESIQALELLQERSPADSGDTLQVVFAADPGETVTEGSNRNEVDALLAELRGLPDVAQVPDPFEEPRTTISEDERIGFATLVLDGIAGTDVSPESITTIVETITEATTDNVQFEAGGPTAQYATAQEPGGGEQIGILVAAVVLFLVFGSVVGMLTPLLVAIFALGTAISIITLLTHVVAVPEFAPILATLIGLGVGIDYCLFVVTRFRSALHHGATTEDAVRRSIDTSGRAVVFAGIIVCIALLGMFALQVSFLYGVAVSAATAVLITMIAAVTLLPAVLGMLGPKIDRWRLGRKVPRDPDDLSHSTGWSRWALRIQRHPVIATVVGAAILVALCVPAFALRLGSSDAGNDPADTTTRRAYDLLAEGFGPGFNGQFLLVADIEEGADGGPVLDELAAALQDDPDVATVTPPMMLPDGQTGLMSVFLQSAPQDEETTEFLTRARSDIIPAATAGTGVTVYVGGITAIFQDFGDVLADKLPLFIGVVVLLSFLLLMAVFRSLLVPLKAAVMNLLAIGAAFGVVVVIFQWGWGADLIGVQPGPIEAFLPVMLFAILFGLSMDYEVFLVSRIHEEWVHTHDNTRAVTRGLAVTGRVITAAALIMFSVFLSFVFGGQRVIQLFGIGLATAVLLDALVIRSLLVPGIMHLIGKPNWWLPSWLDRILPNISVEGPAVREEEAERELIEEELGETPEPAAR